jgi:regulator of replication initiation timing
MSSTRDRVEELARELDMVVFRLERSGLDVALDEMLRERRRVRQELERLRDRMEELARGL